MPAGVYLPRSDERGLLVRGYLGSHTSAILAVIAVAMLATGVLISPVYAEDKNPAAPAAAKKIEDLKPGTRDRTEAEAQAAQDAYNKYQEACANGTDEQKEAAKKDWEEKKKRVEIAIAIEAGETKEAREALDNLDHLNKKYSQLQKNPNSSEFDLAKAKNDFYKASENYFKVKDKAAAKISEEIRARFTYDAPESCPPPAKKKKKKDKGETSGPLDFIGNVTIGVGVDVGGGDHHRRGDHRSHENRTDDKSASDAKNCCSHQGQSVKCPQGLPGGSSSVEFVTGGTTWQTPTGSQVFVPQTSFPTCTSTPR